MFPDEVKKMKRNISKVKVKPITKKMLTAKEERKLNEHTLKQMENRVNKLLLEEQMASKKMS